MNGNKDQGKGVGFLIKRACMSAMAIAPFHAIDIRKLALLVGLLGLFLNPPSYAASPNDGFNPDANGPVLTRHRR